MDNDCLVNIFKLLGSPLRRHIIKELRKRPLVVSELQKILNISQPALSHQLRELENAGIVEMREEPRKAASKKHYYSLRTDKLGALVLEAAQEIAPEAITQARQRKRTA